MVQPMLYELRIDPEKVDRVHEYFDALGERGAVFRRGLELENMYSEGAWLRQDESGPVLYYYEEASEDYPPADLDPDDLDDELQALSEDHHEFFEEVAAPDAELVEFDHLFFETTIDRDG